MFTLTQDARSATHQTSAKLDEPFSPKHDVMTSKGSCLAVDGITVTYSRRSPDMGGPLKPWEVQSVEVSGFLRRRNGSLGATRTRQLLTAQGTLPENPEDRWIAEFNWVAEFVGDFFPDWLTD